MPPKETYGSIHCFSQNNPSGPGQGSVPDLLRRVADTIYGLGDVKVFDITYSRDPGYAGEESDLCMTVYYHPLTSDGSRI
jgi:hypothetical protein